MIQHLDDRKAEQILVAIARSLRSSGVKPPTWSSDLEHAVASEFDVEPGAPPVSDGELARQALVLLAEDPEMHASIETMAANWDDSVQRFDFGAALSLTTAALIALQTHVKFERTSNGKWTLRIEKKPTRDGLLKALAEKIIRF